MSEDSNAITIRKQDFEASLQNLNDFRKYTTEPAHIDKVDTREGLFGLREHKVTGDELNSVTNQIQSTGS